MIRSLDAFTVSVDYGRASTTFDLHVDGQREPVARMHKDGAYDSRFPYQVHGGPGLGELLGHVTPFAAMTADRAEIGTVRHRERTLRQDEWIFTQHGLPALTGSPVGASSTLRHASPLRVVLDHPWGDALLSYRLRFRAEDSAGFELARLAGLRARYAVKIDDPRVDRLLVLACVAQFNTYSAADPRKTAVDVTSNPLKG